jgi:hypothetical protein
MHMWKGRTLQIREKMYFENSYFNSDFKIVDISKLQNAHKKCVGQRSHIVS